MPYRHLLFDIDDTLLDFKAAENQAISLLMTELAIDPSEENVQNYSSINRSYWSQFEEGLIAKDVLIAKRFETFFSLHQREVNGQEMDRKFRSHLEKGHFLIDGSIPLLESLKRSHGLYAVTNGVARTQHRRITDSGLEAYFRAIFVSEETGYQKPMKEYFDYVFENIPDFRSEEALIIGDSLTSDIQGGINAGIATCWFNPEGKTNRSAIQPTYEIASLDELPALLN